MTKFYAIGTYSDEVEGTQAVNTGEYALPAEATRENIEWVLAAENDAATRLAESVFGDMYVFELVPVGKLREVNL